MLCSIKDFVDDILLLESTIPRTQAQLTATAKDAKSVGLKISISTTEYMTMNITGEHEISVNVKQI